MHPQQQVGSVIVPASFRADDGSEHIEFDAAPYLRQASLPELGGLADCGFRGDYAADEVARWSATTHPSLSAALDRDQEDQIGFEVAVDRHQALIYLAAHRVDFFVEEILVRTDAGRGTTTFADLTNDACRTALANLLDGDGIDLVIEEVLHAIYTLALAVGPDATLTDPSGRVQDYIGGAPALRARAYRRAGVSLREMLYLENNISGPPTDRELDILGALHNGGNTTRLVSV